MNTLRGQVVDYIRCGVELFRQAKDRRDACGGGGQSNAKERKGAERTNPRIEIRHYGRQCEYKKLESFPPFTPLRSLSKYRKGRLMYSRFEDLRGHPLAEATGLSSCL